MTPELIHIPIPALPRGFELNGDPEHDREEVAWAQMEGCSASPVGQREAFDAWRATVGAVLAPVGWTAYAGRMVSGEVYLRLSSPRTSEPWEDALHKSTGTQDVWQEVSAVWRGGVLTLRNGGVVVRPDDLHQHAAVVLANQSSPGSRKWHADLEAARTRITDLYRSGALGASPREAADWMEAAYFYQRMPRPLVERESQRLRQALDYLRAAGLEALATTAGICFNATGTTPGETP